MRAFLAACAAAIILAICGVLALGAVQKPSGVAFSTDAARIDPAWSWRHVFRRSARNPPVPRVQAATAEEMSAAMAQLGPEGCDEVNAYRWIFVDFGDADESDACTVSQ
jgi:hypothetical protein